jgi:hypothetical protein
MVKAFIYNMIPARQSYVRPFWIGGARFSLVNVAAVWFISPLYVIYKKKRDGFPMTGLGEIQ